MEKGDEDGGAGGGRSSVPCGWRLGHTARLAALTASAGVRQGHCPSGTEARALLDDQALWLLPGLGRDSPMQAGPRVPKERSLS